MQISKQLLSSNVAEFFHYVTNIIIYKAALKETSVIIQLNKKNYWSILVMKQSHFNLVKVKTYNVTLFSRLFV